MIHGCISLAEQRFARYLLPVKHGNTYTASNVIPDFVKIVGTGYCMLQLADKAQLVEYSLGYSLHNFFCLSLLAASVALLLSGAGRVSVDEVISKRV